MFARRDLRVKSLMGVALGLAALVIGVWAAPAFGGASEATEDQTLSVSINVPLNEIEDGQFCQAYGIVSGGTSPYTFTGDGQFTDADAQDGPLGDNQIVNGFISSARPDWLKVDVQDSSNPPEMGADSVVLNIGDEFNEECEA